MKLTIYDRVRFTLNALRAANAACRKFDAAIKQGMQADHVFEVNMKLTYSRAGRQPFNRAERRKLEATGAKRVI